MVFVSGGWVGNWAPMSAKNERQYRIYIGSAENTPTERMK